MSIGRVAALRQMACSTIALIGAKPVPPATSSAGLRRIVAQKEAARAGHAGAEGRAPAWCSKT
jgi:hypothetical protein